MAQTISRQRKSGSNIKKRVLISRVGKLAKFSDSKKRFAELGSKVTPILKPYADRIYVFGSFARGEATSKSDIDLLITLKPSEARPVLGLLDFIKLEQTLAKKLGREVDLVTEEELNPRRRLNIERDRVVLYEAKR